MKLSAKLSSEDRRGTSVFVTLENVSASPVYIATDPVTSDGRKRLYVSLDEGTLTVASRLYQAPTNLLLIKNDAGVLLQRLAPGEIYRHEFRLPIPLTRTRPPYVPADALGRTIAASEFKNVVVEWGVFRSDTELERILNAKVQKGRVHGGEPLSAGTDVLSLQCILVAEAARE